MKAIQIAKKVVTFKAIVVVLLLVNLYATIHLLGKLDNDLFLMGRAGIWTTDYSDQFQKIQDRLDSINSNISTTDSDLSSGLNDINAELSP